MGTTVSEAAPAGRWVTPEVNYVDPERHFCAFCGRPIARQYWEAAQEDRAPEAYCSPEHAARRAAHGEQAAAAT